MAEREHTISLVVPEGSAGQRVDRWVAHFDDSFPRSVASDEQTQFYINDKAVKKSKTVKPHDRVTVHWIESIFDKIEGQDIPLSIIYEDQQLLVLNKQQSLVVHPGAGNLDNTLVNALVFRYGDQFFTNSGEGDSEEDDDSDTSVRPGIVHRLDKDTSGVMVVAKDRGTHNSLSEQFKERSTEKYYIALVQGQMPKRRGHIQTTLVRDRNNRKRFCVGKEDEGKLAHTDYVVLRQWPTFALVRLRLHTGRTHQIRVHLLHLGCPILGDPIYGRKSEHYRDATLMLHAFSLEITHPVTGVRMRFRAPMPQRFKDIINSTSNIR